MATCGSKNGKHELDCYDAHNRIPPIVKLPTPASKRQSNHEWYPTWTQSEVSMYIGFGIVVKRTSIDRMVTVKRKHCGDKTCYYGVHGKAELFSGSNFCPTCGKPAEVVEVTYKVDDFDDSISDVEERFHHLFRLVFLSKDEFCIIPSIYNCRELGMYADFLHVGETVIDVEASKKRDDVARLIDELKARNLEHTVSFVAVK